MSTASLIKDKPDLSSFEDIVGAISSGKIPNYSPILGLMFNLRGKPYTLEHHFPFEQMFNTQLPSQLIYMTARQTSKSTSNAASTVAMSALIPYFNTLTVTPLSEQVRKYSNNYIRPFIETSNFYSVWVDRRTVQNVLQRTLKNNSIMFFSFAAMAVERIRGISADKIIYDEVQDLDPDHMAIINEVTSASKWDLLQYTGTPKSMDNIIQKLWEKSSQAEWMTPCMACKKENYSCSSLDLYKMIGDIRDDISINNPAVICANCGRPINPRLGRWVHKYPNRKFDFPGYHVPQIILPVHYGDKRKWAKLLAKRAGAGNMSIAKFHNEVLGESYDTGHRPITRKDLQEAAVLHENKLEAALEARKRYDFCVMGVDWGGGGEDKISFTTITISAWDSITNTVDVIYAERLYTPNDHIREADRILQLYNMFKCAIIAHDGCTIGSLRETVLIQRGIDSSRVMPIAYTGPTIGNILVFKPGSEIHNKPHWRADKSRALQLMLHSIKLKRIRFFKYDYIDTDSPGFIEEFLHLVEENYTSTRGPSAYIIYTPPNYTDDFVHSTTYSCLGIWHINSAWPSFADNIRYSGGYEDGVSILETGDIISQSYM